MEGPNEYEDEITYHVGTSDREPFSAFEEFLQYPSDECANTPAAVRSSRRGSQQRLDTLTSSGRKDDLERSDEFRENALALFNLGMSDLINLDHLGQGYLVSLSPSCHLLTIQIWT
jgi:hypothetical protein